MVCWCWPAGWGSRVVICATGANTIPFAAVFLEELAGPALSTRGGAFCLAALPTHRAWGMELYPRAAASSVYFPEGSVSRYSPFSSAVAFQVCEPQVAETSANGTSPPATFRTTPETCSRGPEQGAEKGEMDEDCAKAVAAPHSRQTTESPKERKPTDTSFKDSQAGPQSPAYKMNDLNIPPALRQKTLRTRTNSKCESVATGTTIASLSYIRQKWSDYNPRRNQTRVKTPAAVFLAKRRGDCEIGNL